MRRRATRGNHDGRDAVVRPGGRRLGEDAGPHTEDRLARRPRHSVGAVRARAHLHPQGGVRAPRPPVEARARRAGDCGNVPRCRSGRAATARGRARPAGPRRVGLEGPTSRRGRRARSRARPRHVGSARARDRVGSGAMPHDSHLRTHRGRGRENKPVRPGAGDGGLGALRAGEAAPRRARLRRSPPSLRERAREGPRLRRIGPLALPSCLRRRVPGCEPGAGTAPRSLARRERRSLRRRRSRPGDLRLERE